MERLYKVKSIIYNELFVLNIFFALSFIVVPHITDAIQEWVERVARISVDNDPAEPDICIIEV